MAGFLLDTHMVSKRVKVMPAPQRVAWVNAQTLSERHLSVVTPGELTYGVIRLPGSRQRRQLIRWVWMRIWHPTLSRMR